MFNKSMRGAVIGAAVGVASALAISPALATHGGSSSPELNLVGSVDLNLFGANVTDVWAHGNYAYLGSFDDIFCTLDLTGVHIIDISDPTDPVKVGFIPAKPATRNNDVKVATINTRYFSGEILVITNESCGSPFIPRLRARGGAFLQGQGGVSIWNVSNPEKPRAMVQNFLDFPTHNTFIWQQDGNAYMMVVDDFAVQDVHIVDITKPQSPKVIAVTGQLDWPADIADEFPPNSPVFLHDMWVQENGGQIIAYLAYWDAGLVMLDVTDPANPVFLGDSEYTVPDVLSGEFPAGTGHFAIPNADGSRVLLGDEDFAAGALDSFKLNGTSYPVAEGGFGPPTYTLPGNMYTASVHWTGGNGCNPADIDRPADGNEVALMQRGVCFFSTKAANAQAVGYTGFIVANDAARGDGLITMASGTNDIITIPGYFVGNSTGEIMKTNEGGTIEATGIFDGYGYLRLLNVSNPAAISELDQFASEGVFVNPPLPGDRTIHNMVVDDGTLAYISWYNEGIRVVDFGKDKLKEVAHYTRNFAEQDLSFWGVYLHDHPDGNTYVLGSERNSGLFIFDTPADRPGRRQRGKP